MTLKQATLRRGGMDVLFIPICVDAVSKRSTATLISKRTRVRRIGGRRMRTKTIDVKRVRFSKCSKEVRDNFKPQFGFQQCNRGWCWEKTLKKALYESITFIIQASREGEKTGTGSPLNFQLLRHDFIIRSVCCSRVCVILHTLRAHISSRSDHTSAHLCSKRLALQVQIWFEYIILFFF